jgi:MoaA/NifB/PqqE/SkfB family radical SAM enzyme
MMPAVPPLRSDRRYRLKRFAYHVRIALRALRRRAPVRDYARMAAPLLLRGAGSVPHALYVEFSNVCDIRCAYCACPTFASREPFLRGDVLDALARALRATPVNKVHIGGGEPTLHPSFAAAAEALRPHARFLDVVTNGQWRDEALPAVLGSGLFDMVEVSVDAGEGSAYETIRAGASAARLLRNLEALRRARDAARSGTILALRLMVRPSTKHREREELRRWRAHCDTIIPQYVIQPAALPRGDDLCPAATALGQDWPRCTAPSRALQIKADGTVPLCCIQGHRAAPDAVILGTILQRGIAELWRHPLLEQYRSAHRFRRRGAMPACRGCVGA